MNRLAVIDDDMMYRLLVQGVADYAIYMLDLDGVVLNWNIGAERAKGYSAAEIVGQNFERFYNEEDQQAGRPKFALDKARTEGRYTTEGWRVRRDGSCFWASVVLEPVRDALGALIGFAKITRDLTDRKVQDDALRRVASNLDLALSHMSQGLILFDADERIVLCNAQWRDIVGGDEAVICPGTTLVELLHHLYSLYGSDPAKVAEQVSAEHERFLTNSAQDRGSIAEEARVAQKSIVFSSRYLPEGGWVCTAEDVTDRRITEERIVRLAGHDVLTELPNRLAVHRAIYEAATVATASQPCALFYIDLDRFKPVNDTFGHHAGDTVLRVVADRLRGLLRQRDVAARLGGDEFAVVAHDCHDDASATIVAERLIREIGQPIKIEGGTVTVSASIGIALMPAAGMDADSLLRHADLALYQAKQAGRSGFCFYDGDLETPLRARRDLERDLRRALEHDELSLHYQPVVAAVTNRPTGMEALLRWTSSTRGPITPIDFIPFAEEIGLMPEIDDWVMRQACATATTWPADITISVNLSPTSLHWPGLATRVSMILSETGLPASRLELEITETAMISNLDNASRILAEIQSLGVHIALDDFGTGYSSLSLIRRLPFTRIKIDRSFVKDMDVDPHASAIVTAVCGLCRSLGVRATAEGVETTMQADRLSVEGCSDIQGYLIARPMNAEAVLGWLHAATTGSSIDA